MGYTVLDARSLGDGAGLVDRLLVELFIMLEPGTSYFADMMPLLLTI